MYCTAYLKIMDHINIMNLILDYVVGCCFGGLLGCFGGLGLGDVGYAMRFVGYHC